MEADHFAGFSWDKMCLCGTMNVRSQMERLTRLHHQRTSYGTDSISVKKTSDFFVNIKGKNNSYTNRNMSNVSVSHLFYLLLSFCIAPFLSLCLSYPAVQTRMAFHRVALNASVVCENVHHAHACGVWVCVGERFYTAIGLFRNTSWVFYIDDIFRCR